MRRKELDVLGDQTYIGSELPQAKACGVSWITWGDPDDALIKCLQVHYEYVHLIFSTTIRLPSIQILSLS